MACSSCGKSSTVKYQVSDAEGEVIGTYDSRSIARTHRPDGGKIRPVRVPS